VAAGGAEPSVVPASARGSIAGAACRGAAGLWVSSMDQDDIVKPLVIALSAGALIWFLRNVRRARARNRAHCCARCGKSMRGGGRTLDMGALPDAELGIEVRMCDRCHAATLKPPTEM